MDGGVKLRVDSRGLHIVILSDRMYLHYLQILCANKLKIAPAIAEK